MLYLTSVSGHTGRCSTCVRTGSALERQQPGRCSWELGTDFGSCERRAADAGFGGQGESGLCKRGVFYSCVLTHYFMVGFSLYTENKVIIFSPFLDV